MPGMSGIELCKKYIEIQRNTKKYKEIRPEGQIIFISGYSDKEYLLEAISMGALDYVEKPLSIERLTEVIKRAIQKVNTTTRYLENTLHRQLQVKETARQVGQRFCRDMRQR